MDWLLVSGCLAVDLFPWPFLLYGGGPGKCASEALSALPEVRHVDLWNRNVEFIEQEAAWERPAVFVELEPIAWKSNKDLLLGSGRMHLHLVTDWMGSAAQGSPDRQQALEMFRLAIRVDARLLGLEGKGFAIRGLLQSATNHDHEDIVESIETFEVRYALALNENAFTIIEG